MNKEAFKEDLVRDLRDASHLFTFFLFIVVSDRKRKEKGLNTKLHRYNLSVWASCSDILLLSGRREPQ